MAKEFLSDEEVELEIARLMHSEDVILAKMEMRIKNKRRQYMYSLRTMERRGKQLAAEGVTTENIEAMLFGKLPEDDE